MPLTAPTADAVPLLSVFNAARTRANSYERRPRFTFRAKRQGAAKMVKNMETLSDGLPRAARTRKEAMNANQSTDHARGAAAQRDATVQKLEAALLAQHEQARHKLMLALNSGVSECQHAAAFAQAAAACFERAAFPRGSAHHRSDDDH